MWNNYPDGMRESDIPGWNEYDTSVTDATCDASDVTLSFVDLEIVESYLIKIYNLVNNEFLKINSDELKTILDKISELTKIIKHPVNAEVYNCPFNDDVEAVGDGNEIYWSCPWCQTEHQFTLEP
jgi:hypothetical protein